jgi:hypothetical protein
MFSDDARADEDVDAFGDAFSMNEMNPTTQEATTEQLEENPPAREVTDSGFDKAVDNLVNLLVLEGQFMPQPNRAHQQRQGLDPTSDALQFPSDSMATSQNLRKARRTIIYDDNKRSDARTANAYADPSFLSAPVCS